MAAQHLASVSVVHAEENDKPVIANLIQLYLYDMMDDLPFPIQRDGRFGYDFLEQFWQHPYLLFVGEELAGFALIIDHCPITGKQPCYFMAEFFVLKMYRRQNVGRTAVAHLLDRHSGPWHIGVIDRNKRAATFWSKILTDRQPAISEHHFDGENWIIHEFTTPN